jgi:hypothetical protein
MNNKTRKLLFIRSKNDMKKNGHFFPKWKVTSKKYPFKYVNTSPSLLEDSYIIDFKLRS